MRIILKTEDELVKVAIFAGLKSVSKPQFKRMHQKILDALREYEQLTTIYPEDNIKTEAYPDHIDTIKKV